MHKSVSLLITAMLLSPFLSLHAQACVSPTYYVADWKDSTVCWPNAYPFLWYGQGIYEAGLYETVLKDKNGCDSVKLRLNLISEECSTDDPNSGVKLDLHIDCRYASLYGRMGNDLRRGLHELIKNHTVLSYYAIRADQAGVDLTESNQVMDMYSSCSFGYKNYCGYGEFSSCECYNREHTLPKSYWGGGTDEPMYTDLHHVIPTDFFSNSQRSAWIYDEVSNVTWTNGVSKLGNSKHFAKETAFEPADEYKGDIARIYFYMMTCYMDKNFTKAGKGYQYFTFADGEGDFNSSSLCLMLKWHRQDPVSDKEVTRNTKVEHLQGNRNPFVDDPNLAEYIWSLTTTPYACNGEMVEVDTTHIPGSITCQKAREIGLALEPGSYANELGSQTVVGYVTNITQPFDAFSKKQSFWLADNEGGGQVFMGYNCTMDSTVLVGDKVAISGVILNYDGKPQIKNAPIRLLQRHQGGEQAVEEVVVDIHAADCQVYTIMGQNVSAVRNHLPSGLYIVQKGYKTKRILVQ